MVAHMSWHRRPPVARCPCVGLCRRAWTDRVLARAPARHRCRTRERIDHTSELARSRTTCLPDDDVMMIVDTGTWTRDVAPACGGGVPRAPEASRHGREARQGSE